MTIPDWDVEWLICGVIVLAVGLVGLAAYQDKQHRDFLKANGCQLLTQAPTGRHVYCGKGCFRDEYVYVYECIDGTRTEAR
jgi:hypothetical protein